MSRAASRRLPSETNSSAFPTPSNPAERIAELREIPVELIDLPKSPARRFLGDIAGLAESMQDYGLQQPISVRVEGDRFRLTSGMRRLAAARTLGWRAIAAFVRSLSADDAYVVDLVENLQREDLSPEEEADALSELLRTRGWTLQQVADALKRSVAYVSKRVRVFEDTRLREAVTRQNLPISTAEELLAADPDQRLPLIKRALVERWDQGRAREAVRPPELEFPAKITLAREPGAPGALGTGDYSAQSIQSEGRQLVARPQGFTRAVREFHRLIMSMRAEHLTTADRSALRSLFRDLVMLGRAPTVPRKPVFPELPTTLGSSRLQPARPRSASRRKGGPPRSARSGRP